MKSRFITMLTLSILICIASVSYWSMYFSTWVDNSGDMGLTQILMIVVMVFLGLSLFIMGIVTLAMNKDEARGFGIAAGVLGIVGGFTSSWGAVALACAIVSGIGAWKLKDAE